MSICYEMLSQHLKLPNLPRLPNTIWKRWYNVMHFRSCERFFKVIQPKKNSSWKLARVIKISYWLFSRSYFTYLRYKDKKRQKVNCLLYCTYIFLKYVQNIRNLFREKRGLSLMYIILHFQSIYIYYQIRNNLQLNILPKYITKYVILQYVNVV